MGESLTFGNAEHLPNIEALDALRLKWDEHSLRNTTGGSSQIAHVPDDPNSVVRWMYRYYHSGDLTHENLIDNVHRGIRHFRQLEQFGIQIPPQRFVIAPSLHVEDADEAAMQLFAFTDRLEGRELTTNPDDAQYAVPVIASIARYFSWAHQGEEQFLWDIDDARQYTILKTGAVILHDVGLEFGTTHGERIYESASNLLSWAESAQVRLPKSARKFLRAVEPMKAQLRRYIRFQFM